MKHLIIITSIFLSISASAQEWQVKGNELTWEHVYNVKNNSIEGIAKRVTDKLNLLGYNYNFVNDQIITGSFQGTDFELKKYGYSAMTVPMFMVGGLHSGTFKIQIKPGRYKIEVTEIKTIDNTVNWNWSNDFIKNNGSLKRRFRKAMDIGEKNLLDIFSYKDDIISQEIDNDF
jgi:hypothetical protein